MFELDVMGAPSSESQLIYRYLFIDEKKKKCWWKRKKSIMGADGNKQEDVEQMVVPKVSILLTSLIATMEHSLPLHAHVQGQGNSGARRKHVKAAVT